MYQTLSIIVPFFNEEKTIGIVLEKVINADSCGLKKEIILVDDASTDKSNVVVSSKLKVTRRNSGIVSIKIVQFENNMGKGAAVKAGLQKATGDIVLIQDADLEYDPADYPMLLSPILSGRADVVYGSRFVGTQPRRVLYFWHYVGNTFLTTLSNICTNLNLTDMETGFKVFSGKHIRQIAENLRSTGFGIEPELTARIAKLPGVRVYEVGISYNGRTYVEGKKIRWYHGLQAVYAVIRYGLFS